MGCDCVNGVLVPRRRGSGCPPTRHRPGLLGGMSGDQAVNPVCIASRNSLPWCGSCSVIINVCVTVVPGYQTFHTLYILILPISIGLQLLLQYGLQSCQGWRAGVFPDTPASGSCYLRDTGECVAGSLCPGLHMESHPQCATAKGTYPKKQCCEILKPLDRINPADLSTLR